MTIATVLKELTAAHTSVGLAAVFGALLVAAAVEAVPAVLRMLTTSYRSTFRDVPVESSAQPKTANSAMLTHAVRTPETPVTVSRTK